MTEGAAWQAEPLTTVQAQLIVERVELVLDILGTGAVLAGAEVQKDIDLVKNAQRRERTVRRGGDLEREKPQEQQPASRRMKT